MSDQIHVVSQPEGPGERPVPIMQELYDNFWILFLLSLCIVLVSYLIWGLIDMLSFPALP